MDHDDAVLCTRVRLHALCAMVAAGGEPEAWQVARAIALMPAAPWPPEPADLADLAGQASVADWLAAADRPGTRRTVDGASRSGCDRFETVDKDDEETHYGVVEKARVVPKAFRGGFTMSPLQYCMRVQEALVSVDAHGVLRSEWLYDQALASTAVSLALEGEYHRALEIAEAIAECWHLVV